MKELSAVKAEKKRGVKEEVKEVRRREAEGTRHPKGESYEIGRRIKSEKGIMY